MAAPAPLEVRLAPRVRAVFTTRNGGVSAAPYDELNLALHVGDDPRAVRDNRATSAACLGLDAARVVWSEQVHGAAVAVVTGADAGRGGQRADDAIPGCDALVTEERDLPLAVLAADCVPLLLADSAGASVGAVHAGRSGLVAGVVEAGVDRVRSLGARPGDVVGVIGPHIGPCCYEVGDDVYDVVTSRLPGTAARSARGARSLDLAAGVRAVLAACGVGAVDQVGGCTSCDADRWFSYRRDRVTGRHAGIVWREA